jgi:hypothetical protein
MDENLRIKEGFLGRRRGQAGQGEPAEGLEQQRDRKSDIFQHFEGHVSATPPHPTGKWARISHPREFFFGKMKKGRTQSAVWEGVRSKAIRRHVSVVCR